MASLPAGGEKVILVGHSMAGYTLCMAMERFPEKVSVAVFLSAGMLGPDLTFEMVNKKVKLGIYCPSLSLSRPPLQLTIYIRSNSSVFLSMLNSR
ncbi:unnamed protein product [Linum tenue]|nr:unnamed protein product [Linum tenue]